MATEREVLMRRWFEDIWNRGNVDAADELLAPNAVLHETATGADQRQSLADFKAMVRVFRDAIPDIRFDVEQILECDEHVVARVSAKGTHSGAGLGLPATGRPFRIAGIVIARIVKGRTVEGWSSFDILSLYEQLGAVKRPVPDAMR